MFVEELILRALVLLFAILMEIYAGTGTGLQLHLADQNYQVCIMPQSGFHSIRWQPTPPSPIAGAATSTFVMTGPFIGFGGAVGVYYKQFKF